MSETSGPWYVEDRFAPEMYLVRHSINGNVPDKRFTVLSAAKKYCRSLNAAERVRDAAPALLAACKAALNHAAKSGDADCDCELCQQLRTAIHQAEVGAG